MSKATAKVFKTGRSQAVRIPKQFRFNCDEVFIEKDGANVILTPKHKAWDKYMAEGRRFSEDFPDDIEDAPPKERENL